MIRAIRFIGELSIGPWARSVRMALKLTQNELADMAGVLSADVDSFEHNLPVRMDTRRKLVKILWAARNA